MKITKIIGMAVAMLFAGCATANQKPTPDYEKYDVKYKPPMTQTLSSKTKVNTVKIKQKENIVAKNGKKVLVRVTYYSPRESGGDRWTRKFQSSTGVKLVNKKAAAVDPRVFPYGSRISLPQIGMSVKAVDTGSAVKSKKAALAWGKNVPVVDVFVESNKEAMRLAASAPMFQEVIVLN